MKRLQNVALNVAVFAFLCGSCGYAANSVPSDDAQSEIITTSAAADVERARMIGSIVGGILGTGLTVLCLWKPCLEHYHEYKNRPSRRPLTDEEAKAATERMLDTISDVRMWGALADGDRDAFRDEERLVELRMLRRLNERD